MAVLIKKFDEGKKLNFGVEFSGECRSLIVIEKPAKQTAARFRRIAIGSRPGYFELCKVRF